MNGFRKFCKENGVPVHDIPRSRKGQYKLDLNCSLRLEDVAKIDLFLRLFCQLQVHVEKSVYDSFPSHIKEAFEEVK